MELHKPHAAKTWREFFIEIGTIVTGILIALALEQGLEALHEHKIKKEAQEAVLRSHAMEFGWITPTGLPHVARLIARIEDPSEALPDAARSRGAPKAGQMAASDYVCRRSFFVLRQWGRLQKESCRSDPT